MKVLTKFHGVVNQFNAPPELTYVTLKNVDTGEVIDSNAITEKLVAAGIDHDGCEFEVTILQDDAGKQTATMKKVEPKEITPEQLSSIVNEVDHQLGGEGNFEI